jgi:L-2-hydroxyglutarate oxidase LhgO
MRLKRFTSLYGVALAVLCLSMTEVFSQKWSGVNGNEWLVGKYGQQWVRIGVSDKRAFIKSQFHRLPAAFQSADKTKLQLWHRGIQVSILKADSTPKYYFTECPTTVRQTHCCTAHPQFSY